MVCFLTLLFQDLFLRSSLLTFRLLKLFVSDVFSCLFQVYVLVSNVPVLFSHSSFSLSQFPISCQEVFSKSFFSLLLFPSLFDCFAIISSLSLFVKYFFTFFQKYGLKWTRTTDLTLIRRAL